MQSRTPVTFSRHVQIGAELHRTIEFLHSLRAELQNTKPNKYATEAKGDITRAIRRLDILRNTMENLLCTSGVDTQADRNPCAVYYGPFDRGQK